MRRCRGPSIEGGRLSCRSGPILANNAWKTACARFVKVPTMNQQGESLFRGCRLETAVVLG